MNMKAEARKVRRRLRNARGVLNELWNHAHKEFKDQRLNGGRMRNLDDAAQWLNDTLEALDEFVKGEMNRGA
jgi:hypothetical protein